MQTESESESELSSRFASNPEHSTRLSGWRHENLLLAHTWLRLFTILPLSFVLRLRQLRCLSISPTPTPTPTPSPTQSKSPSPTPTRLHRHNRTDTDTDTNSSTLDCQPLTTITDRHKFASDSSDRYTDRLSSSTRTRHTHDLRSVSHAYFLTRSRLPYAHRRHRSCTQSEADTERGCRSDHRSHPLIPVISGPTSPRRRSELRLRTIRRYCGNIRRWIRI
jgi:hypothetical protein